MTGVTSQVIRVRQVFFCVCVPAATIWCVCGGDVILCVTTKQQELPVSKCVRCVCVRLAVLLNNVTDQVKSTSSPKETKKNKNGLRYESTAFGWWQSSSEAAFIFGQFIAAKQRDRHVAGQPSSSQRREGQSQRLVGN